MAIWDASIGWIAFKPVSGEVAVPVSSRVAGGSIVVGLVLSDALGRVVWSHPFPAADFKVWQSITYRATIPRTDMTASGVALVATATTAAGKIATRGQAVKVLGPPRPDAPPPVVIVPIDVVPAPGLPPITTRIVVTGDGLFRKRVAAALETLARVPEAAAVVAGALTEIKQGPTNWSWGGSRVVQISPGSLGTDTYGASIILHEAEHVRLWQAGSFPVFGCDGEARVLTVQAAFLRKVGDTGMASWVDSLRGSWC